MLIKSIHRAAVIPSLESPHNVIHLKIYYPAQQENSDFEKQHGIFKALSVEGGLPVIIWIPGINCGPEVYRWLAIDILKHVPAIFITFSLIGETLPGIIGLTAGVDLPSIKPDNYGKTPTTKVIQPILTFLEQENKVELSPLKDAINLNKIILSGHSAGGTMALQNASHFPQVVGAFTYGAHNAAPTFFGYEPGKFLEIPGHIPYLILGGSIDGVIANSASRYKTKDSEETSGWHPIIQSFHQGFKRQENDSFLIILKGANHMLLCHPEDPTAGRSFLDNPCEKPSEFYRDCVVKLVASFLENHVLKLEKRELPAVPEVINQFKDDIDVFEKK
jgi:pimeloyl-ACP methyl ester carboxylesterase